MKPWQEKNNKAIINVVSLKYTKRVKVRKNWCCEMCGKTIHKGEYAIRQGIEHAQRGDGYYDVYFHNNCCEVNIGKLIQYKDGKTTLEWQWVNWD